MSEARVLDMDEVDEMERRIHKSWAMSKFSPQDIMNLIATSKAKDKAIQALTRLITSQTCIVRTDTIRRY